MEEQRDRYEQYESLIEREEQLLRQIRTGELCLFALLETMYRKDCEMDVETVKAIVQRVYNETDEQRSELWQVRMEKTILAVQLKPESR